MSIPEVFKKYKTTLPKLWCEECYCLYTITHNCVEIDVSLNDEGAGLYGTYPIIEQILERGLKIWIDNMYPVLTLEIALYFSEIDFKPPITYIEYHESWTLSESNFMDAFTSPNIYPVKFYQWILQNVGHEIWGHNLYLCTIPIPLELLSKITPKYNIEDFYWNLIFRGLDPQNLYIVCKDNPKLILFIIETYGAYKILQHYRQIFSKIVLPQLKLHVLDKIYKPGGTGAILAEFHFKDVASGNYIEYPAQAT